MVLIESAIREQGDNRRFRAQMHVHVLNQLGKDCFDFVSGRMRRNRPEQLTAKSEHAPVLCVKYGVPPLKGASP
jgi:hypothetical protein